MKVIVGIGDSWTQGQGGVPYRFFEEWGGRVDRSDNETEPKLLKYELENSWVNVLTRDYFKDHVPINLGMRGYGNRGAVKNLYHYPLPENITGGCMVFMLSSRIRFDIVAPTGYTQYRRRFRTYYPHGGDNKEKPGEENWYRLEYTEYLAKVETLHNILEAQMIAKLNNLEFYFASAFEFMDDLTALPDEHYNLSMQINWDRYLTPNTNYYQFLNNLNNTPDRTWNDYTNMPYPDTYITNCVHPTIEGYKAIAQDLSTKINL
jgi:hypothetical protein